MKGQVTDNARQSPQGKKLLAGVRVPNRDEPIGAAGNEPRSVGIKGYPRHLGGVPYQRAESLPVSAFQILIVLSLLALARRLPLG